MTELELYVPTFGSYFHFVVETLLAVQRELAPRGLLGSGRAQLWYEGNYPRALELLAGARVVAERPSARDRVPMLEHERRGLVIEARELHALRDVLLDRIARPPRAAPPGITVIQRSKTRRIANHDELVAGLARLSLPVRVAPLEQMAFDDQVNLMRTTTTLVGPHGAGFINLMFLPPGAAICELYPRGFANRNWPYLAGAFDLAYRELEAAEPGTIRHQPPPDVRAYLDEHGWPTRRQRLVARRVRRIAGRPLSHDHAVLHRDADGDARPAISARSPSTSRAWSPPSPRSSAGRARRCGPASSTRIAAPAPGYGDEVMMMSAPP